MSMRANEVTFTFGLGASCMRRRVNPHARFRNCGVLPIAAVPAARQDSRHGGSHPDR